MGEKKLICVICPVGCEIYGTINKGKLQEIKGHRCEQGEEYAREEFTSPARILTATVNIRGGRVSQLPVKSSGPLPREKIEPAMKVLAQVMQKAPVQEGQVIIENILNTGKDLIATRSMDVLD